MAVTWAKLAYEDNVVTKALFDADTFLYATNDNTPVATSPANVLAALSGHAAAEFSFNTQKVGGIVDPTTDQQAATKKYVDDEVSDVAGHAILDGSVHTDSVADAVSRGSIIYGNATPKWDELVVGAANTFLGSDGTDVSYRTAAQVRASLGIIPLEIDLIVKTGDENVNNSATLQNDDELLFALAASEEWEFTCTLFFYSTAAADLKFAFTVPTGATIFMGAVGKGTGGTVLSQAVYGSGQTLAVSGDDALYQTVIIKGYVTNGANAGNCQLQWAQNSAVAVNSTVYTKSNIVAHRTA